VQATQILVPWDSDQASKQFGSNAKRLEAVVDEDSQFGFVAAMKHAQAPNRNYFWRVGFSLVLAQKHHLAIVISEANTAKTFVC